VQAIKARHQRAQLQVAAKVACEKFYAFANAPELAAAVKSLNQFTQSPVWLEFGRKFEALLQSPFMQAIQAFAKSPEAKRLAEWANNPEVRRWADLSRSLQTTLPRHFIPPRG
jgi:hypothetical protein